jgi:hypothetical protein
VKRRRTKEGMERGVGMKGKEMRRRRGREKGRDSTK